MGMNLQYQAVPADSGLLELVRDLAKRFPGDCWAVAHIPWLLVRGLDRVPGEDEFVLREIMAWCDHARARYPGIEHHSFEPGRHIGSWKFLLSATYRQHTRWPKPEPHDPRSWNDPPSAFDALVDIALFGAPEIAPNICAGQGNPVQYIAPVTAADFGTCVAALELSDLNPHLEEILATHRSGWDRELWVRAINAFQTFWRETAERGDGALVIYD